MHVPHSDTRSSFAARLEDCNRVSEHVGLTCTSERAKAQQTLSRKLKIDSLLLYQQKNPHRKLGKAVLAVTGHPGYFEMGGNW